MIMQDNKDLATAIKSYMDQAGFDVDIDVADPGRFFGSLWGTGFDDMLLFFSGLDPTYLVTFQRWFGHDPLTNIASFKARPSCSPFQENRSPIPRRRTRKRSPRKLVRMLADEADIIPLYNITAAFMARPYVHSTYLKEGLVQWRTFDDWLEKK